MNHSTQWKNKACNKNRYKGSSEAVAIFCKCRLLETDKMVSCETCNKWYHNTCCGVTTGVKQWQQFSYFGHVHMHFVTLFCIIVTDSVHVYMQTAWNFPAPHCNTYTYVHVTTCFVCLFHCHFLPLRRAPLVLYICLVHTCSLLLLCCRPTVASLSLPCKPTALMQSEHLQHQWLRQHHLWALSVLK